MYRQLILERDVRIVGKIFWLCDIGDGFFGDHYWFPSQLESLILAQNERWRHA